MDIRDLTDFFGGSIFSDEYRGDFAAINDSLQQWEPDSDHCSAEEQARRTIIRGIFAILKGNMSEAYRFLDKLVHFSDLHPRWQSRHASYMNLWHSLHRFPRLIRFSLELGGPVSLRTREWKLAEHFNFHVSCCKRLADQLSPLEQHEVLVLLLLWNLPFSLWIAALPQHPRYPKGPTTMTSEEIKASFAQTMSSTINLHNSASRIGMPEIAAFLDIIQLEHTLAAGLPNAPTVLRNLQLRFESAGNKHHLAMTKMMEADDILSPPFSSPVVLNLIIKETFVVGGSHNIWDVTDMGLELCESEQANRLYTDAFELFKANKSPRGCAAILLRQACVEHAMGLKDKISAEERHRRLEAARRKFEQAFGAFEFDEGHRMIIQGHQILLRITRNDEDEDGKMLEDATKIGQWGRLVQNEQISWFVGMMMLRFGRKQMLKYNRNGIAYRCFRYARECFRHLEYRFGVLQALQWEVYTLLAIHDHAAAKDTSELSNKEFRTCLEDFDKIAAATADQDIKINVACLKQMMIDSYSYLISEVYHKTGEEQRAKEWYAEMTRLRDGNSAKISMIDMQHILPKMAARLGPEGMAEHFDLSRKCMSDWKLAHMNYEKEVKALEFDKANAHLRKFLAEYETITSSCFALSILAAVQIGEIDKAREILDKVSDEELFDDSADVTGDISRLYSPSHAETALSCCWLARDWSRGCRVIEQIKKASPTFFDDAGPDHYERFWCRLVTAGIVLEQHGQFYKSYSYLIKSTKLLETYRLQIANLQLRRYSIDSPAIEEMFPALARLCVFADKRSLPLGVMGAFPDNQHKHARSWKEHALLFLEQGRARTLLDVFETQAKGDTTHDGKSTSSRDHLHRRRLELRALMQRNNEEKAELQALEEQLKDDHRELPNLHQWVVPMLQAPINPIDLYRAIEDDCLVVETVFTVFGFSLFGITASGIEFCQEYKQKAVERNRLTMGVMKHIKNYKTRKEVLIQEMQDQLCSHKTGTELSSQETEKELKDLLQAISDMLLLPLSDLIRKKKHLIFALSGRLMSFPFAALPFDGKPLILQKSISITPSLSLLFHVSQRAAKSRKPPSISTIAKRVVKTPMTGKPLRMAGIEAVVIAKFFGKAALNGTDMDIERFRALLEESDIIHLAVHGEFYSDSPALSYISLKQSLRVLDILQHQRGHSQLSSSLIVFAACFSGLGEVVRGEDVLGFSHAVLEAGCSAFLGSLWKVNDIATMLLMTQFYRLLRHNDKGASVATLFQKAQAVLYEMGPDQRVEAVLSILRELPAEELDDKNADKFVRGARQHLEDVAKEVRDLDFQHPFFYASFVLVGYGNLVFSGGCD